MLLALSAMIACNKAALDSDFESSFRYGQSLSHEMIVLGSRLENPYKTENITKALTALYPTKADRVTVETTNLYVRFLPASQQECDLLEKMGLTLLDHPLDYDVLVEGDWYHDPEVPDDEVTWQYAVVPADFEFPDITYQIIDECFIAENSPSTKSDGIDWDAVERQAYIMTGNEERLCDVAGTKASSKVYPSGRITIVDPSANGGKPFGVAGVRVSCNSFVKFAHTYTDRDGYYTMPKKYSANLRYRLVFQNERSFSIGFNLILVPASVSTLGKSGPEGVSVTITSDSESKLFRRCVVNNAAYDYIGRCSSDDMDLTPPPSDLRLWIFHSMDASSAVMIHHGAILTGGLFSKFLGRYAPMIQYFMPDVTIGASGKDDYKSLYSVVCHELAHASHFASVGTEYWNKYIEYIIRSYVESGNNLYGDGTGELAGYCEVGEMWAYYLESMMYKERYGGSIPSFGSSCWFQPQIFRYLDERGVSRSSIFSVLKPEVSSMLTLKSELLKSLPNKRTVIEQAFGRYGY